MKFYGKAETAATRILEAFRTGQVPKALANVFIKRKDNVPCRSWSWSNQMIAALWGHSDARGYRQWEQVGRHVRKGSKSFPILGPVTRTTTKKKTDGSEEKCSIVVGFKSIAVFGLSQTEGDDIPSGDAHVDQWLRELPLRAVAESWGLTIETYNGAGASALGRYRHQVDGPGVSIALGVENLSTWTHELTHAADHKLTEGGLKGGQQIDQEVVAELGSAVLLECLGKPADADIGGAWDYIQHYEKAEPITVCQRLLKRTCNAVALILDTADELAANRKGTP